MNRIRIAACATVKTGLSVGCWSVVAFVLMVACGFLMFEVLHIPRLQDIESRLIKSLLIGVYSLSIAYAFFVAAWLIRYLYCANRDGCSQRKWLPSLWPRD